MIKKSGFTLAEVLIVLVILGVVAAMTVPNLLNNSNSAQFSTGIKKAFAALNQTIQMAAVESGEIPGVGNSADGPGILTNLFGAHMRISGYGVYTHNKTGDWTAKTKADPGDAIATADGMIYKIGAFVDGCGTIPDEQTQAAITAANPCTMILVDVNGRKGPNALTEDNKKDKINDQFLLYLFKNGVVAATDEPTAFVLAGSDKETLSTAKPNFK